MQTAVPADVAGRDLRGAALLSLAVHAFVLALPVTWWLVATNSPREVEAQVEVVFGDNAELTGTPAGPAAAAVAATPDGTPPTAETPRPSGGKVGLLMPHPDPDMIEAHSDPGNRAPKYPDGAWLARQRGEVVIRLHIGPDGRVSRAELRRSSGHAELDQAAAEALAKWRFLPAMRDGVAVASYRDQATDFELEDVR